MAVLFVHLSALLCIFYGGMLTERRLKCRDIALMCFYGVLIALVLAMRALKDSLRVPDRMGWNGDPCAPTTWNAWEGIACRSNKDGNALVISQMYAVLCIYVSLVISALTLSSGIFL